MTPLADLDPADPQYASRVVDRLLAAGRAAGASDLHLQAAAEGLETKLRIDGVLQPLALVPRALAANVVARLKVQAELLTYRTDTPQEGRIRLGDGDVEMRLSTFPTLFGESAVVRLFGRAGQYEQLADLGLPGDVLPVLEEQLGETAGAILVSGPAGSGKTTTVYACLRGLAARAAGARSLVSLEDPIEVAVPGVAQSQVNPAAGLDLATGLRFLMRQDPEVIMVGEIRDRATAEAAMQASLTGRLKSWRSPCCRNIGILCGRFHRTTQDIHFAGCGSRRSLLRHGSVAAAENCRSLPPAGNIASAGFGTSGIGNTRSRMKTT